MATIKPVKISEKVMADAKPIHIISVSKKTEI
jgi:hypothetical protein